jgi:hypothetical protein
MPQRSCACPACLALLVECGPDLFPLYAKKLLIRGWAGVMTPAERAYRRAHADAYQAAASRMAGVRSQLRRNTASVSGVSAQSGGL